MRRKNGWIILFILYTFITKLVNFSQLKQKLKLPVFSVIKKKRCQLRIVILLQSWSVSNIICKLRTTYLKFSLQTSNFKLQISNIDQNLKLQYRTFSSNFNLQLQNSNSNINLKLQLKTSTSTFSFNYNSKLQFQNQLWILKLPLQTFQVSIWNFKFNLRI